MFRRNASPRMRSKPVKWLGSNVRYWNVLRHIVTLVAVSLTRKVAVVGLIKSRGCTGISWPL